ncbi:MAG: T9SS type A sorting domain-containing protein [Bacteroidales bacterium]|nr:T9SS type A sorting domain-containing protein [Bacteroidales bacterium]MCF8403646.1 T9SS type A sorting domain-containing protein [Bacteroidales bacterium]
MKKLIYLFLLVIPATYLFSQNEHTIGNTFYDIQTTRSMQDRICHFDDGTIGAVYNMSQNPNAYDDLAIGYNYFDGVYWGPEPFTSITSGIATNPSYSNYGENGEIVASEGQNGLYINYRTEKGTGNWQEMIFPGPAGCTKLYSPQLVTSGADNHIIHLFALCKDQSIQLDYQDNIAKVLYSRTSDGGATWDILHYEIPITSGSFGFSELSLITAQPKANVLAFVIGDYFTNLLLLKSIDGGDTWQETMIWEHPYPNMEFGTTVTDTFWANTGSMDIAIDSELKANVVFSLCHISSQVLTIWYSDTLADGVVYWNEDRDVFSNNINALNPQGHPDSELIQDYSLISWSQDINGNGVLNLLWNFGEYGIQGISTMPSICISEWDQIFVTWASVTETYNNGMEDYRHLWARSSPSGDWWGGFQDLTGDLIHIFDECVFPNLASYVDDYLHLIYMYDSQPGILPWNTEPTLNTITYMKVPLEGPPMSVWADFIADTTLIHAGESIQFTNLSYGYPPDMLEFEWLFEGGNPASSSDTNPVVIYPVAGTYDVTLTSSIQTFTSHTKHMADYITVLPQTIIDDGKEIGIMISPNPTRGDITIKLMEPALSLRIYDVIGSRVYYNGELSSGTIQKVDMAHFSSGIYYLQIEMGNRHVTKKIILKKD